MTIPCPYQGGSLETLPSPYKGGDLQILPSPYQGSSLLTAPVPYQGMQSDILPSPYCSTPIPPPLSEFVSEWDTTNTSGSSSAANQVALPLEVTGTYNFTVDWGDGNEDTITVWNQAERVHTYDVAGVYTITISGLIDGFRFGGALDRFKILDISQWGTLKVGNGGSYFWGCENLIGTATDVLDLTGTTTLFQMFRLCPLFEGNSIGLWDVSNVTNMTAMLSQSTLPTVNYDALLIGWNGLPSLQNNVTFSGGSSQYSAGAAAAARANIISTFNWTIIDGGQAP